MASFRGKALKLTLWVYRAMKIQGRPMNIWRIYRSLESDGLPTVGTVGRRVHKLEEEGYLRIDHTETRPRGVLVDFYVPTAKFDLAVEEKIWTKPVVIIPKAVQDTIKAFLRTAVAKDMGLYTVGDVVDTAVREILKKYGLYAGDPRVIRDLRDRVLERADRR